jgi:hypothetical protein
MPTVAKKVGLSLENHNGIIVPHSARKLSFFINKPQKESDCLVTKGRFVALCLI